MFLYSDFGYVVPCSFCVVPRFVLPCYFKRSRSCFADCWRIAYDAQARGQADSTRCGAGCEGSRGPRLGGKRSGVSTDLAPREIYKFYCCLETARNSFNSKFNFPNNLSKVLEIGAGSAPHYKFINHNYDEYHIADTSEIVLKNYDYEIIFSDNHSSDSTQKIIKLNSISSQLQAAYDYSDQKLVYFLRYRNYWLKNILLITDYDQYPYLTDDEMKKLYNFYSNEPNYIPGLIKFRFVGHYKNIVTSINNLEYISKKSKM